MYGFEKRERGNARFISCFKRGLTALQGCSRRRRGVRDFVVLFFCGVEKGLYCAVLCRLWNSAPTAFAAGSPPTSIAAAGFPKRMFIGKVRRQRHFDRQSIVTWPNKCPMKQTVSRDVKRTFFSIFSEGQKSDEISYHRDASRRVSKMCFKRMYK